MNPPSRPVEPRPADVVRDPVTEAYAAHVDRTLLLENLALTPEERILKLTAHLRFAEALQKAGRSLRP